MGKLNLYSSPHFHSKSQRRILFRCKTDLLHALVHNHQNCPNNQPVRSWNGSVIDLSKISNCFSANYKQVNREQIRGVRFFVKKICVYITMRFDKKYWTKSTRSLLSTFIQEINNCWTILYHFCEYKSVLLKIYWFFSSY